MERKTLYNTMSDNIAGQCRLKHCALTVKQIKTKECLRKNCHHFVKNENHEWWAQRDRAKEKKKMDKYIRELTF